MKIELRNVKYAAFASQETACFEAAVYVDGVRAGTARNEGQGGATFVEPQSLSERIEGYAATLSVEGLDMGDGTTFEMRPNGEVVIGRLLDEWLVERDCRRLLGKRVIFTKADGQIYQTPVLPKDRLAGLIRDPALLRSKFPGAVVILNLLPFAEAVALYRKSAS